MLKVGVFTLQGAVREHVCSIEEAEAEAVVIKTIEQLGEVDGLFLTGGESPTIRRIIDKYDFMEDLK